MDYDNTYDPIGNSRLRQFVLFHQSDFFLCRSGLDNKSISDFYAEVYNNSVDLLDQRVKGYDILLAAIIDGLVQVVVHRGIIIEP